MFKGLKKLFSGGEEKSALASGDAESQATPARDAQSDAFLRREAVFDARNRPAGFLLRLQPPGAEETNTFYPNPVNDRILLDLLAAPMAEWNGGTAFVPLAAASLSAAAVHKLNPAKTVLLLTLGATDNGEEVAEHMAELQARGFHIGIFRAPQHPAFAKAMAQADSAAIVVAQSEPASIRDFSAAIRANTGDRKQQLLALNIDSADEHRLCQQWHYELFHGEFARHSPRRPEDPGGDPHKALLLNLLRLIQGDAETDEIANAMKQDPLLAFRVLRYLNSPALGLTRRIDSLGQALVILGRQRLTRWVAILLFSVREPNLGDWLLVENSLTRGRLMELLGEQLLPGQASDPLFLTGIFSCLDRLIRRPVSEVIADMPLAEAVKQALLERSGPHAPLLAIAEACEEFDLPKMKAAAESVGLTPDAVNRALLAATVWASEVTEHWE